MAKATGREAIRLWFEFLKRAYQSPTINVDKKFYKAWGDVGNTKYENWWKEKGKELFPYNKVEIVERYLSNAGTLKISVPLALTPTVAANQLREVLMLHYERIGHSPKPQQSFALTDGAEIKVSALRAYLVTYDANTKLEQSLKLQRVPAKLLLSEVRRFYLARTHKWQHTKRNVEGLPMALAGEIEYDSLTDSVSSHSDDISAERSVRRYLAIANNLVEAAARGDFPSNDYSILTQNSRKIDL